MKSSGKSQRTKLVRAQRKLESQASDVCAVAALRQEITNRVCAEAISMVEMTIEQVQNDHYLALKYLFEMVGLYPAAGAEEGPQQDSLAEALLRQLGVSTAEFEPSGDAVE